MVPLQSDFDHGTQSHVLTCFMFPQQPPADEGGSGCLRHLFYSNLVSGIDFYGGFFPFHSLPFPSSQLDSLFLPFLFFPSFPFFQFPSCFPSLFHCLDLLFFSLLFLSFHLFSYFRFPFLNFVYPTFLPFCSYSFPSFSFPFLLFFFHFSSLTFFKIGLGYMS